MKCKTTSQSVKLAKKVMDNIKRGFFFESLTTPDKNDENQKQIHLGIQMSLLLRSPRTHCWIW